MNISIDPILADTLATLAVANSTSPEDYASGVLNSHLSTALRRSVSTDIDSRPISEVVVLVASVKDSARLIDDAKPAPKQQPSPAVVDSVIPSEEAIKNGLPL